jgi:hypothetical protein
MSPSACIHGNEWDGRFRLCRLAQAFTRFPLTPGWPREGARTGAAELAPAQRRSPRQRAVGPAAECGGSRDGARRSSRRRAKGPVRRPNPHHRCTTFELRQFLVRRPNPSSSFPRRRRCVTGRPRGRRGAGCPHDEPYVERLERGGAVAAGAEARDVEAGERVGVPPGGAHLAPGARVELLPRHLPHRLRGPKVPAPRRHLLRRGDEREPSPVISRSNAATRSASPSTPASCAPRWVRRSTTQVQGGDGADKLDCRHWRMEVVRTGK